MARKGIAPWEDGNRSALMRFMQTPWAVRQRKIQQFMSLKMMMLLVFCMLTAQKKILLLKPERQQWAGAENAVLKRLATQ